MTLYRKLAKKIFGPFLPYVPPEKAYKYINITRMIYFFSATSLLFLYNEYEKEMEQKALEMGHPVIKDHSGGHRRLREGGVKTATVVEYTPGEGFKTTDLNTDEYYQQLEKESYERAKQAQEKALAEGRELPPGAIRLV